MKVYIMTDLEGVAGVASFDHWTSPGKRYYETARKLLTLEVNAAVEGLAAAGASEIVVADGHGGMGSGGVNIELLDRRAGYLRGWPPGPWPLGLDGSYDALCFVGQHARSGSERAHLAHTQGFRYLDLSVNGVSIGEFGQLAMCASELGVPAVFASGDAALCREAEALVPGIVAVAVKEGLNAGSGDECTAEAYRSRNQSALHMHPEKSREIIREGAGRALGEKGKRGTGLVSMKPPYERVALFRPEGENPMRVSVEKHPDSVIGLFNMPFNPKPAALPAGALKRSG